MRTYVIYPSMKNEFEVKENKIVVPFNISPSDMPLHVTINKTENGTSVLFNNSHALQKTNIVSFDSCVVEFDSMNFKINKMFFDQFNKEKIMNMFLFMYSIKNDSREYHILNTFLTSVELIK